VFSARVRLWLNAFLLALVFLTVSCSVLVVWYSSLPQKFTILVGTSMRPTLNNLYVVRIREPKELERGDIILYFQQMHRIVAMPGETVMVKRGIVYISQRGNTFVLEEPYVKYQYTDWDWPSVTLGIDEYGALGDDRTHPASRILQVVKRDNIAGVFDAILFP